MTGKNTTMLLMFIISAVLNGAATAEPPAVFTDKTFEQARAEAVKDAKLLIVDMTADWCQPCKMMDRTTWVAPEVISWINERAIAIQVDVDRQRDTATELNIRAMPTVIVFKDGEEFDRIVGYRDAEGLLAWLNGVGEGRRAIDAVRESAGSREGDGEVNIEARYELASELVWEKKLDEATEEFVWLWDNMLKHDQAMYGVRLSFMVSDMRELAQAHPPALKAFTKLRDREQKAVYEGAASRENVVDWIHLNDVIGDDQAVLKWYDRVKSDPKFGAILDRVAEDIFDLLIERRRWADAGYALRDPVGRARQRQRAFQISGNRVPAGIPAEHIARIQEMGQRMFRVELSRYYAACLAAGRNKSAAEIAEIMLKEQDTELARFMLIETALRAGSPREQHLQWLDDADEAGEKNAPLRAQLQAALEKQKSEAATGDGGS